MPDYKLVSLEQMKILAGKTKSYVDGKVGSASDIQSGDTVKTFSKDYKTVTTVYANGNQLVKTFSDDMKTITSVLTDSDGTVIATETKTLSDDGLTIDSSLSSLAVDQSLQSSSQIVIGDLTLACHSTQAADLTIDISLSCLKSNLQLRQGSDFNSVCHNTFLLLE